MMARKTLLGFTALLLSLSLAAAARAEAPSLPMVNPSNVPQPSGSAPPQPGTAQARIAAIPSVTASNLFNRDVTPPDPQTIPVLANMLKAGVKLYFLGQRSGLNGWFIVQDGQIQMIYVTQDNKTAIVGGMFTGDGENVTSVQVEELSKVNPEIGTLVNGDGQQAGTQGAAKPVANAGPGSTTVAPPLVAPAPAAVATNPQSPGDRLTADLQNAAGVVVGNPDAPLLLMVIDPNCPHCQATWRELHDAVFANRLQVRLVPIGNISPESVRAAAQLLTVADPLNAWDKYVAGDKKQLEGNPAPARVQSINNNRDLIEKWNIQATPYLVYRGKDGKVKIVQGKPERMAAVLADLVK